MRPVYGRPSTAGAELFHGAMPIFVRRAFRTTPALPKGIGECGDVVRIEIGRPAAGSMPAHGLMMLFLRIQVIPIRMLQGLSGPFMSGQVIFFPVELACDMGVSSQFMVLGSDLL